MNSILYFPVTFNDNLRLNFFEEIIKYNHDDDRSKILFINNVDPYICRLTAAYIYSCMDCRQNTIV